MIRPMRLPNTFLAKYSRVALWAILLALLVLPILGSQPAQAANPTKTPKPSAGSSPAEVLNLVNQLRAANGLAPLKANSALMAAAQAHSEYQASLHIITHYGPGGNGPKDRAASAGYGGGTTFFLSENIYGGTNATAQHAITWWKGDAPHLNTMLGANSIDAGVGVATDGNLVYYTLDVGYISGTPGSGTGDSGATTPVAGATTSVSSNSAVMATPMPDGSIVHTVKEGQTLWIISAIYNVDLREILRLNNFTENTLIYIGQKVIVREPGGTLMPSSTPTTPATYTPRPTATRIPRRTATEVSLAPPAAESSSQPENIIAASPGIDPILALIGALVAGGLALVVVGSLLSGRGTAK